MRTREDIEKRIEHVEDMVARTGSEALAKEIALALWELAGQRAEKPPQMQPPEYGR